VEPAFRPFAPGDRDAVLGLCIAAFEPIHRGFAEALGPEIFARHHADWRGGYARLIAAWPPADRRVRVHVATLAGAGIVAFGLTRLEPRQATGEIGLNAVAPAWQGQGIGRRLYRFLLDDLARRGARSAFVSTGGDRAHEPARRAYRAAGFDRAIPSLHLFRTL
jgi:GNAT superfamily N-acetyltransferase